MRFAIVLCMLVLMDGGRAQTETPLTCGSAGSTTTVTLTELYGIYKYRPPGFYPPTTTCRWLFQIPDASSKISFKITDIYVHCSDSFKVYDGASSSSSIIGGAICCSSTCGATGATKPIYTTTGNNLFVEFITDSSTTAEELGFTFIVIAGRDHSDCTTSRTEIGIELIKQTPVTSPQFPARYNNDFVCTYMYTYPPGKIQVDVVYAELELYAGECKDYIEIYDGDSISSPSVVKTCDAAPPILSYTSTGPGLTLKFSSDNKETFTGFYANIIPVVETPATEPTTTGSTRRRQLPLCLCRVPFYRRKTSLSGEQARARQTREITHIPHDVTQGVRDNLKKQRNT